MATRRTFLKTSLGACAAGAVLIPAEAQSIPAPCYKFIFDERFAEPRAFAESAAARGIATAAIRGDITMLFFDELDLQWKQGPVRLAGYTTPPALFCLDLLARDRGMRVSHCVTRGFDSGPARMLTHAGSIPGTEPRPSGSGQHSRSSKENPLVFWIIQPRASIQT